MKKRIVSVILLLTMVLTLAACGGGDADKLVRLLEVQNGFGGAD